MKTPRTREEIEADILYEDSAGIPKWHLCKCGLVRNLIEKKGK